VPTEVRIPGAATLAHGQARTFEYESDDGPAQGFVLAVRTDEFEGLVAFRNRCAHARLDLDMGLGEFWSNKTQRIYCRTHGARYRPSDGVCDAGPCVGARLDALPLVRDGEDVVVLITTGAKDSSEPPRSPDGPQ
jgi:nitrite reductase/ring-hydroxylating ferredoxin subunit